MSRFDECPVVGCPYGPGEVRAGQLMCPECWRRVTRPTQQRVYRTWRAFTSGHGSMGDYKAARDQALAEARP